MLILKSFVKIWETVQIRNYEIDLQEEQNKNNNLPTKNGHKEIIEDDDDELVKSIWL